MMYMGDYDQKFPHALDPADKYSPIWNGNSIVAGYVMGDIPFITDAMNAYIQSAEVWKCPSDSGFFKPDSINDQLENEETKPSCFAKYKTSYFYRTELMFKRLSDEQLSRPTEINVFMDGHGAWHAYRAMRM